MLLLVIQPSPYPMPWPPPSLWWGLFHFRLQNEELGFRPEFHDFRKQSKIFYSIIHSNIGVRTDRGFSVQVSDSLFLFPDT
jgi:hypothetical protein